MLMERMVFFGILVLLGGMAAIAFWRRGRILAVVSLLLNGSLLLLEPWRLIQALAIMQAETTSVDPDVAIHALEYESLGWTWLVIAPTAALLALAAIFRRPAARV